MTSKVSDVIVIGGGISGEFFLCQGQCTIQSLVLSTCLDLLNQGHQLNSCCCHVHRVTYVSLTSSEPKRELQGVVCLWVIARRWDFYPPPHYN